MSNYEDEIELQVDGGVKSENAGEIKESGPVFLLLDLQFLIVKIIKKQSKAYGKREANKPLFESKEERFV